MESRSRGAIVLFHQAHFSGFFNHVDSWGIIELNFRRQIARDFKRASVK